MDENKKSGKYSYDGALCTTPADRIEMNVAIDYSSLYPVKDGKFHLQGKNLLHETLKVLGTDIKSIGAIADRIRFAKIWYIPKDRSQCFCPTLEPDHTKEDAMDFLCSLNFEYDNGYGIQHVYGTIVFKDDSWLERREYDGSEWWEYKSVPKWGELRCDEYEDALEEICALEE